jgi:hypothetical protein
MPEPPEKLVLGGVVRTGRKIIIQAEFSRAGISPHKMRACFGGSASSPLWSPTSWSTTSGTTTALCAVLVRML